MAKIHGYLGTEAEFDFTATKDAVISLAVTMVVAFSIVASVIFGAAWFKYLRPKMTDRTKAGITQEAIAGEMGLVIKAPGEKSRGHVRFTTPILGDDEWEFICDEKVNVGDKVKIKEASGNTLVVSKAR